MYAFVCLCDTYQAHRLVQYLFNICNMCLSMPPFSSENIIAVAPVTFIAVWVLQVICSYVFMPVSFLMGVPWNDCFEVGRLIGFKIFLNDIAAYSELGKLIRNREAGLQPTLNSVSRVQSYTTFN